MQLHELRERIELTRREADALIAYLETLSDEDWGKQSACDEWTVAEVMGHMDWVFTDVCYDGVSRGLKGDISPHEGYPDPKSYPDPKKLRDVVRHQISRDEAKKRAQDLGPELMPTFKRHVAELCELWGTLNPDNWDTLCYRMAGILPAHTFTTTPITETAMHHWDIRSRISPETAYLSSESFPYFMQGRFMQRFLERNVPISGKELPGPLRFRFNFEGNKSANLDFVLVGDSMTTERESSVEPDVSFRCDEETLVLIIYGRLTCEQAIESNRLSFDGPESLARGFFEA